jgi:zinc/manganese transport system substrate-binding protein
MRNLRNVLFLFLALGGVALGDLKVASLHPLMTDIVRHVGGEEVSIVEIGKPGLNVHSFQPAAQDLQAMAKCSVIFASGKGLEPYLSDLRDGVGTTEIVEVGKTIPSIVSTEDCAHYGHDHDHNDEHQGSIDPHWWHDVANMRRAVKVVERVLSKHAPSLEADFAKRSRDLQNEYRELENWTRVELAKVPQSRRRLVTAHAAFGYFCKAYDFEASSILGLSGDHEIPAQELLAELKKVRKQGIKTVFPEKLSNPKVLAQVAAEAGAELGRPLVADGAVASYEEMVRGNVAAIVAGLGAVNENP